jgi:hypothetical protein
MITKTETDASIYKRIIAEAMANVITEIQLADPVCLIAMITNGHAANIADLVDSSTELYFLRGTLRYALNADCCVRWRGTPVVRLDMEFRHGRVCAFFKLVVGKKQGDVEIQEVLFDERGLDACAKQERLIEALSAAQIWKTPSLRGA